MPLATMRSAASDAAGAVRAVKKSEKAVSTAGVAPCAAESTTLASAATTRGGSATARAERLRLSDIWFAELRGVDRHVQLDVAELEVVAAVEPGERPAERKLDPADVAVVRVVDLRRHAADRRAAVAHHPHEQTRTIVEVERRQRPVRAVPLH